MTTMDIIVPDIGDIDDVEVIEILVSEGDTVNLDDSLITLESDKASMEIPALANGVITTISIEVGARVSAGTIIGTMEAHGEITAADGTGSDTAATQVPSSALQDTNTNQQSQPQSQPGNNPSTDPALPVTGETPSKVAAAPHPPPSGTSPTAKIDSERHKKSHAGPGVRRYARVHGADLTVITGTGPKSRILKGDVTAFIRNSMEGLGSNYGGAGSTGSGIPPIPEVDFSRFGETERVELSRIGKISATNLHRAWLNVPMVTHHDEADITEMEAFRQTLKKQAKEGDAKVTGLAFHMKALAQTLKQFPKVNSSMSPDGEAMIYKKYFHIGIAVDTPNGLVVPVVRDVNLKSVTELADDMADLSVRARSKKLKPDEMQGASMTISSLGGIGGTAFTPIVNPPEVAILGITRAKMQPVWDGTAFVPRLMCPLDMSYDHRAVDGADAARFMAFYCQVIGDIRRLLL